VPEVWVGGTKREMSELAALLRRERKTLGKVIVRADREVAYEWISPVLVACAQADIRDVRFATRPQ
jgi:biopolymer transport protein ExbD